MTSIHHSKIDPWLLVVLISAMVLSFYASITVLAAGSAAAWLLLPLMVGAGIVLPLWLLSGTRYILQSGQLTIRSGPFKWRISVSDITGIALARDPRSSPALSLDRLRIDYGRGQCVMISPRDKEQFIKDVKIHG